MGQDALPLEIGPGAVDLRSTSTSQGGSITNGSIPVTRFLAVDPGAVHVGVARFGREHGTMPWKCLWAKEIDVPGLIAYVVSAGEEQLVHEIVIERFIINLDMLMKGKRERGYAGLSEDAVETIECVGAVRVLCAMARIPLVKQTPSQGLKDGPKERARVGLRDDQLLSRNPHARSAELHGWFRILKHRGKEWQPGGLTGSQRVW